MPKSLFFTCLILSVCLPACNKWTSQPSEEQKVTALVEKRDRYERTVVEHIERMLEVPEEDVKTIHSLCEEIRFALRDYITVESERLHLSSLASIKSSYESLSGTNEFTASDSWKQVVSLGPILRALQTDILFDTQTILSIDPPHKNYYPGKLAKLCPVLDAFLRVSFDDPQEYVQWLTVDLF